MNTPKLLDPEARKKAYEPLNKLIAGEEDKPSVEALQALSDIIRGEDYLTAAAVLELLPDSIPRDPFYAGMASGLSRAADQLRTETADKDTESRAAELVQDLAEHYKGMTPYFGE